MANGETFNSLFAQFTRLRQTGLTREQAWSRIEAQAARLAQPERERLVGLLRSWEAKEGRNFQVEPEGDPYQTHTAPPEGLVDVLGDLETGPLTPPAQPSAQGIKTPRLRRIKPLEATAERSDAAGSPATHANQRSHVCANCGTTNRPGELLCANCGQALGDSALNPGSTHRLSVPGVRDSAYFGKDTVLVLRVHGAENAIRVRPGNSELVIGRCSPDSVMIPDVDLAPYGAEKLGVSRLHAALRRHENTLVLTDMGSLNHTRINGQRVHAHEVRVVHDGDRLQFGRLRVSVYFEQG